MGCPSNDPLESDPESFGPSRTRPQPTRNLFDPPVKPTGFALDEV